MTDNVRKLIESCNRLRESNRGGSIHHIAKCVSDVCECLAAVERDPAEAPPGIDVGTVRQSEWTASNYFDTDECGIIADDNAIVIPLRSGLPRELCERIAADHNAALAAQPDTQVEDAIAALCPDPIVREITMLGEVLKPDSGWCQKSKELAATVRRHLLAAQPTKSDIRTAWDRDTPYWRCRAELAEAAGYLRVKIREDRHEKTCNCHVCTFLVRHTNVTNAPNEIAMDGIKDEADGSEART